MQIKGLNLLFIYFNILIHMILTIHGKTFDRLLKKKDDYATYLTPKKAKKEKEKKCSKT